MNMIAKIKHLPTAITLSLSDHLDEGPIDCDIDKTGCEFKFKKIEWKSDLDF